MNERKDPFSDIRFEVMRGREKNRMIEGRKQTFFVTVLSKQRITFDQPCP